jgi:hypothetical protein
MQFLLRVRAQCAVCFATGLNACLVFVRTLSFGGGGCTTL